MGFQNTPKLGSWNPEILNPEILSRFYRIFQNFSGFFRIFQEFLGIFRSQYQKCLDFFPDLFNILGTSKIFNKQNFNTIEFLKKVILKIPEKKTNNSTNTSTDPQKKLHNPFNHCARPRRQSSRNSSWLLSSVCLTHSPLLPPFLLESQLFSAA